MVVALSVMHKSLIVAGMETEVVGWGRGGIVLTFIKSLGV